MEKVKFLHSKSKNFNVRINSNSSSWLKPGGSMSAFAKGLFLVKFQWSTAVCFCVLTIGCTVFACVHSARTTSDNLAIIQANTARDVALSFKTSAPKMTFTLGDNMAKVMKAQGPPREIYDGCKGSNDDGYKVWVYWQSPGVPDNLDSYSANNKMDVVDFDSGGHVAYWDNHTGDLCVGAIK